MHRIFIKVCFYTNALCSNSNFLLSSEQFWVLSLSHHGEAQRLPKCNNTGSAWPAEWGCQRVWGNFRSSGLFQSMEFRAEGIHVCSSWKKKLQQKKGFLIIKYTRFTLFRSGYKGSPKFKNPKNCTASCTHYMKSQWWSISLQLWIICHLSMVRCFLAIVLRTTIYRLTHLLTSEVSHICL